MIVSFQRFNHFIAVWWNFRSNSLPTTFRFAVSVDDRFVASPRTALVWWYMQTVCVAQWTAPNTMATFIHRSHRELFVLVLWKNETNAYWRWARILRCSFRTWYCWTNKWWALVGESILAVGGDCFVYLWFKFSIGMYIVQCVIIKCTSPFEATNWIDRLNVVHVFSISDACVWHLSFESFRIRYELQSQCA